MPNKKLITITLRTKVSVLHRRYLRAALHRELDKILRQLREKDKKGD